MLAWPPFVNYGVHMETKHATAAEAVKAAYRNAERTQRWVAKKSGIAEGTFNRRMNGGGDFTVSELARIAKALNIHPSELLPSEFISQAQSAA